MRLRDTRSAVLLLLLNLLASVAFLQAPRPSIYIQAQSSLGHVLARSIVKRQVHVDLAAEQEEANYFLRVSPIQLKKGEVVTCPYTYKDFTCSFVFARRDAYGAPDAAQVSVMLKSTSGKIVWVYTARVGKARQRTETLLADAIAKHLKSFIRINGGLAVGSGRLRQARFAPANAFAVRTWSVFLIPEGYRGRVYIVPGVSNGESLDETREEVIYRIPKDGVLRVTAASLPQTDWTDYLYERGDGSLRRIDELGFVSPYFDIYGFHCRNCGDDIGVSSLHPVTVKGPVGCTKDHLEFSIDTVDRLLVDYQQEQLGHDSPGQSILCPN